MIKIHMGCGKRIFGPDWYNVDAANYPHVCSHDIWLSDVDSDSVSLLYSAHFIEYFDRQEIEPLLKEWYRVIKPGGKIRIAVPDFIAMADAVLNDGFKLKDILGPLYGRMQMNDQIVYHKTVYDFESLKQVLEDAGFKNVLYYDWRRTEHAHIDDHSHAYLPHDPEAIKAGIFNDHILISLNVEAIK